MSTRSDIIVQRRDGKFARIYCHFDGYLDGVGKTLFDHYGDQDKIEAMIALGSLSSLGEEIGEKHDFNFGMKYPFGHPEYERLDRMCNAYGRDRGESNTAAWVFETLAEAWPSPGSWTEFTYVWIDGTWYIGKADGEIKLMPLGSVLGDQPAIEVSGADVDAAAHR